MADAMNVTISRYKGSETGPSHGAARLAMIAAGTHSLQSIAKKPLLDRIVEPQTSQYHYHNEQLKRWRKLYKALKPFAARAFCT